MNPPYTLWLETAGLLETNCSGLQLGSRDLVASTLNHVHGNLMIIVY